MAVDRGKIKFNNIPDRDASEEFLGKQADKEIGNTTEFYPLWLSKRFLILILLFSGYFFEFMLKVSINIAILEMNGNGTDTNDNITHLETNCNITNTAGHIVFLEMKFNVTNTTGNIPGLEMNDNATNANGNKKICKRKEFCWNSTEVGLVLASHPYGYFFSMFGGYLVTKIGGSTTYGGMTMLMSLITILSPIILRRCGFYPFIACRILAGIFNGVAYASNAEIFSRWVPTNEKSRFMSIIFTGVYIAVAVAYPVFGNVALFWGWEMIFYLAGGSCFIWSIIWLIIVRNEPSEDKHISKKELSYILKETETSPRNEIIHPYKEILTSAPVWALCVAKLTYGIGFAITITYLPQYVKDMTHRKIDEIGVIASLPNFVCIFITPVVGAIMDYLQNKHNLKPSQVHKVLMTLGYITGSLLFGVAALGNNFILSMTCFILIKLFLSFNFLILQLICLYMAPRHSSVLLGMTATWYVLSHVTVPLIVGLIVQHHTTEEWSTCFLLIAGILMIGGIWYLIYGSSEVQPWAVSLVQYKSTDLAETETNEVKMNYR